MMGGLEYTNCGGTQSISSRIIWKVRKQRALNQRKYKCTENTVLIWGEISHLVYVKISSMKHGSYHKWFCCKRSISNDMDPLLEVEQVLITQHGVSDCQFSFLVSAFCTHLQDKFTASGACTQLWCWFQILNLLLLVLFLLTLRWEGPPWICLLFTALFAGLFSNTSSIPWGISLRSIVCSLQVITKYKNMILFQSFTMENA